MTKCAYCRGPLPKDEHGHDVPRHPGTCRCGMPYRASWFGADEHGNPYDRDVQVGLA